MEKGRFKFHRGKSYRVKIEFRWSRKIMSSKIVKELSGGMKRKLSLAMAIVSKPKLIILDEPTSGLDIESRKQVWALIKKIKVGRSIIMSS